jgi:hypothetical protein
MDSANNVSLILKEQPDLNWWISRRVATKFYRKRLPSGQPRLLVPPNYQPRQELVQVLNRVILECTSLHDYQVAKEVLVLEEVHLKPSL